MTGDNSTDKFRPDDTLTRYEMAVILQKAFHLPVKQMTFSMMFQIIFGQQTLFVHCIVMALQRDWKLSIWRRNECNKRTICNVYV